MKRYSLVIVAGLLLALSVTGCRKTVKGAGEDIGAAGDKIEEVTK